MKTKASSAAVAANADVCHNSVSFQYAPFLTALQSIKTLVVHSARGMTHAMLCYQVPPRDQWKVTLSSCFEVFGFDFMMDDNFETWLIEINGQPALAEVTRRPHLNHKVLVPQLCRLRWWLFL